MLIFAHVLIAFLGLIYSSYLYFNPSDDKFKPAYWLLGSTIGSGSLLVVIGGASVLKTCVLGLLYTGVIYGAIIAAKHKLAREDLKIK
jgi:hypothetical protein